MATIYNNSVPLGREGTGSAQIFGPNRALQYYMQTNQRDQDRLYREQQQYFDRQSQFNNAFQKQLMEMSELAASPMFSNDFTELTNNLVRQGGEMMARGENPLNPNQGSAMRESSTQFMRDMGRIRSAKAIADLMNKERQEVTKAYQENPQDFDFDEYKTYMDFEKNNTLEDVLNGARPTRPSKVFNINEGLIKQYGQLSQEFTNFTTDEQGNPVRREITQADMPRITGVVQAELNNPSSPYYAELNRRLRRDLGQGANISGLLMTTDESEIRSILDQEFRNPSDFNPIVELMASGVEAIPGTPEYESFLNSAVQEQLKAERVYDNVAQNAANALVGRVNPRERVRFDFSLNNERRADRRMELAEQSNRRMERNSYISYLNGLQRLQGASERDMTFLEGSEDIDFSSYDEDGGVIEGESGIYIPNASMVSTPNFKVSAVDGIDVKSGRKTNEEAGDFAINGVGVVAFDRDGNVVEGDVESLVGDNRVSEFRPVVTGKKTTRSSSGRSSTKDIIYSPSSLPLGSLTRNYRSTIEGAISAQGKIAQEMNRRRQQIRDVQPTNRRQSTQQTNTRFIGVPQGGF